MPKLDGFEVLELLDAAAGGGLRHRLRRVRARAFEVHAVDYLLKPFGRERLRRGARAQVRACASAGDPGRARRRPSGAALAAAARAPGRYRRARAGADGAKRARDPGRARRLHRGAGRLRRASAARAKTYLKPQTLAELAAGLDPARFVRIHRSYVLNVERIARLELYAKDSRVAILKDGTQLPVSRAGYARLQGAAVRGAPAEYQA